MKAWTNFKNVPWGSLALLFLSSRLLILLLAWLTPMFIEPGKFSDGDVSILQIFERWDVNWYLSIANNGYDYTPGKESSVAFFPLFPILMRLLGFLLGSPVAAGYLISNLCLFISIVLLWKLTETWALEQGNALHQPKGTLAVSFLLFGQTSFFFSIPYTESTFLCLMLVCFYAASRKRWLMAGLAGFGAALTRNVGVLLVIPLLVEYFEVKLHRPWFNRELPLWRAWPCLLPIGGLSVWCIYLAWDFGNPLLFMEVQAAWGRRLTWPWETFLHEFHRPSLSYKIWFLLHAFGGIALFLATALLRLRLSLVIFSGLLLLLNISAQHLEAIPRLLSVIFPFYISLAALSGRFPNLPYVFLCIATSLLVLSVTLFVNGYWFT